eukprot:TRINITY_DN6958_c0_g7_i1.p1 TRINITY_DN6958_c0_g7~~TRINITY_DN6958_c0_g7_i1.p1  ORF type:complete len:273 (+),score=63.02 TRINITY_DN6958_c0_g7_i1:55-819(+)
MDWKGKGQGRWGGKNGVKGNGKGHGRGKGKGGGGYRSQEGLASWDEAQLRQLSESAAREPVDLSRIRPQRPVDAFPHLTVAADWPERRAPRSGSAFFLPLIWSALLLDDCPDGSFVGATGTARRQLETLGDAAHFHKGQVRRSTIDEVILSVTYWEQVFSGWPSWIRRMRAAMESFQGGRDGLVAAHVQQLSVTAGALIYGNLHQLGALPHICNARRSPDQDAILELDLMLRVEMEACITTLFLPGGIEAAILT